MLPESTVLLYCIRIVRIFVFSGLDYAIMSGGDVGPLGKDAVSWADFGWVDAMWCHESVCENSPMEGIMHTSAVRFILQPAFQFEGTQVQSLCCDYGSCFLVCLPSHFFSLFCVRNERAWVVCLESSILSASSHAGEHFWPHWGSVSCCDCRQADKTVSCLNLQLIRLGLKD